MGRKRLNSPQLLCLNGAEVAMGHTLALINPIDQLSLFFLIIIIIIYLFSPSDNKENFAVFIYGGIGSFINYTLILPNNHI